MTFTNVSMNDYENLFELSEDELASVNGGEFGFDGLGACGTCGGFFGFPFGFGACGACGFGSFVPGPFVTAASTAVANDFAFNTNFAHHTAFNTSFFTLIS
jgi:bacteriocin-like protein